ncbi:Rieske (2Fe-2S) protein [Phenylobacterium sp.]|uniref:Rieske (2Fe-2S) protein n=1 Tax=Phenylobacterium sp. TaxID=1871053 RepID=UPI0030F4903C
MNRNEPDNPARPPAGQRLCALADLSDPGAKGFRFRHERALFAGFLVRQGDAISGYVDSCPHNGWPLAVMDDRYLTREGDRIICAAHGAMFRPADGLCVAGPCADDQLRPWPVTVVDGEIVTA